MLCELNRFISWRKLYGKPEEDKRQRDVELILRFMALREELHRYEKPMKDFLSTFMSEHRSGNEKMSDWATLFSRTCDVILDKLGAKPFHIRAGLNAAVFDSVFVSISKHLENIPDDLKSRYKELIKDNEFLTYVSSSTTDGYVVPQRIKIAEKYLFSK